MSFNSNEVVVPVLPVHLRTRLSLTTLRRGYFVYLLFLFLGSHLPMVIKSRKGKHRGYTGFAFKGEGVLVVVFPYSLHTVDFALGAS